MQYQPGYSEFANVVKVSLVFSQNEKGRAPKKRGTELLRTELEPSIIGTVCQKEGFDKRLGNVYEGKKQNYHIEEMESYVN